MTAVSDRVREWLLAATVAPPPAPWRHVGTWIVGGLTHVGFGVGQNGAEYLLVLSPDGRGVFDLDGRKVARDYSPDTGHDVAAMEAPGIGPLDGQPVRVAGVSGGGLPCVTDGWALETFAIDWPDVRVVLMPTGADLWMPRRLDLCHLIHAESFFEFRVAGFSQRGGGLVVASGGEVTLFARN